MFFCCQGSLILTLGMLLLKYCKWLTATPTLVRQYAILIHILALTRIQNSINKYEEVILEMNDAWKHYNLYKVQVLLFFFFLIGINIFRNYVILNLRTNTVYPTWKFAKFARIYSLVTPLAPKFIHVHT